MKKIFALIAVAFISVMLVSCGPKYDPIINVDDFDKSWTFDTSITTKITFRSA